MRRRIRSAGQALYDTGAYFYDAIRENTTQIQYDTIQWEEAVVVDIITNDSHPQYSADGFNVGAIQFRFVNNDAYRTDSQLIWAWPIESNISEYPLRNEIVFVILSDSNNVFFYTRKLNLRNRVTANPKFGVIAGVKGNEPSSKTTADKRNIDEGEAPKKSENVANASINRLGENFQDRYDIFRLRHHEGDVIIEGRSGQSIRLGSELQETGPQQPNILFRCGADLTQEILASPYALVSESFDNDDSSLWMVSKQIIPLKFATVENDSHFVSMIDPPTLLEGAQIALNSGRIILNSKTQNILVSSLRGTHFSAGENFTVDAEKEYKSYSVGGRTVKTDQNYNITTGKDYLLNVGNNQNSFVTGSTTQRSTGTHSITAEKIYIGSLMDETEPAVFGEQLRQFLEGLVKILEDNAASFTLPTVGNGPLNPTVIAQLNMLIDNFKLKTAKEATFQSQTVFVSDAQNGE